MCEYAKYLSLIGRVVAITAGARGHCRFIASVQMAFCAKRTGSDLNFYIEINNGL